MPARPEPVRAGPVPHGPGRGPRAVGIATSETPAQDGHRPREQAPQAGGTEELTVDIELLEIVERQPTAPTSSARRPPVSLSDYLTRRAH
jgi:hypothetical protein